MMSNRVTLDQARQMTVAEIASLPAAMLAILMEELAALKLDTKRLDDKLRDALNARYSATAQYKRGLLGKDTGIVTFDDDGVKVSAELPKQVEWSQPELHKAVATLRSLSEDPREYVEINVKVSEAKYSAWPKSIRDLFAHARTVGAGKPVYKLTMKEAA